MTGEDKLHQAYYQADRLKFTSMSKKDIKSWLAKQVLWQIHKPTPKEINHPYNDVTKPNEHHQFDILYMPHNLFERNAYKSILTGIDVASRYKVAKPLKTKNQANLHLYWRQSMNKVARSNVPRLSIGIIVLSLKMK